MAPPVFSVEFQGITKETEAASAFTSAYAWCVNYPLLELHVDNSKKTEAFKWLARLTLVKGFSKQMSDHSLPV